MFNSKLSSESPFQFTHFCSRPHCPRQAGFPRNLKSGSTKSKYFSTLFFSSSLPFQILSPFAGSNLLQIVLWTHRFNYFLLSCLLFQSLKVTRGEPHRVAEHQVNLQHFSSFSSASSPTTTYIQPNMVAPNGSSPVITTLSPPFSRNPSYSSQQVDNQNGNFVRVPLQPPPHAVEHTSSVIASSFRTFENQQPSQEDSEEGLGTNSSSNQGMRRKSHMLRNCETLVLKECLDGLPPMNATGIPSTHQAVTAACRIYDAGMSCFDNWAKPCLQEKHRQKVKTSIMGAHEMYTFLCKDHKFRNDYLKHGSCYKRLSPHWDECSRQFVDGLRRNTKHNYTAFCCIRIEFFICVSKYSSYTCNREASRFVMKMAETLVRSSIRTKSGDYCMNVQPDNCIPIVDSAGGMETLQQSTILLIVNFIIISFYICRDFC